MKKLIYPKRLYTWPTLINGLTISRILIGLPIIFALQSGNNALFILLFLIGGLTDFFDGYLARTYNYESVFGAKLDPLADKVLIIAPLIWLVHENIVPIWAIWLIISRELIITSWRSHISSGAPASTQGKYKTTLQFISITLLLWPQDWGNTSTLYIINLIGYIAFWICFFLTFSSALKYIFTQKDSHRN
tara:strand:+ start:42 stop:611 length:570 start_codon:yes stop_codon:yes gene_type:complete